MHKKQDKVTEATHEREQHPRHREPPGLRNGLEYTHLSREGAARAIQSVVGGRITHTGGSYDEWTVHADDGKKWKAVSDGSLGSRATSAEVVTPILHWNDLDTLQKVVRALRRARARTPACTSQHVHIGVEDFTAAQIANFARIWYKQEKLILKAVGTLPNRLSWYTRPTDREFIARLERMKPQTRRALNIGWFGHALPPGPHGADSRTDEAGNRTPADGHADEECPLFRSDLCP